MRFIVRLIGKVILLLLIGLWGTLVVLSYNKKFVQSISQTVTHLVEKRCNAHMSGELTNLSLSTFSATFKNVSFHPFDIQEGWHSKMQSVEIYLSPWTFLTKKKWGISLVIHGCTVYSEIFNGRIALVQYVTNLLALQDSSLPLQLQSLRLFDLQVSLQDAMRPYRITCTWNCDIHTRDQAFKGHLFLRSGSFEYDKKEIITQMNGKVDLEMTPEGNLSVFPECRCVLSQLSPNQNQWFFSGQWLQNKGLFSVVNQDKSVSFSPLSLEKTDEGIGVQMRGTFPVKIILRCAEVPFSEQVTGVCAIALEGIIGRKLEGAVTLTDLGIGAQRIDVIQGSFAVDGQDARGTVIYTQEGNSFVSDWIWNHTKHYLKFVGTNTQPLKLIASDWHIPEGKLKLRGTLSSLLHGTFFYQVYAQQKKTESCVAFEGKVTSKGLEFVHTGTLFTNEREYNVSVSSAPFALRVLEKHGGNGEPVLAMEKKGSVVTGTLQGIFVQNLLQEYQGMPLSFQGTWQIRASLQKDSSLKAVIALEDGVIRKPDLYNFIHSMHADISVDMVHKQIAVEHLTIALQKGSIESSSIKAGYDHSHKEWWAHIPITCTDCFINWKKDLYVLFSGSVVLKKMLGRSPELEGFILFERAQLKENIFSQYAQQALVQSFSPSTVQKKLGIKLALSTRTPLGVKTAQLETQAMLSLMCEGEMCKPAVTGDVFLQGGMIHFPANSLAIVKGKISFAGENTIDPLIELVAQARVKKYLITMSLAGTGQDPQITFDSVPSLSQEQCMMLLIAGSEEESLNIVAPALIMRNIENVIFGSSYRARNNSWLSPLKRIKFVPRFTDQTGRGGFKGALEIEVNKRLRGIIEKNFSLTEDVSFEVEYDLNDSTSVRALLDERGDLGAEVEMRFKF